MGRNQIWDTSRVVIFSKAIFLGQFCPRGKRAMRLTLCEAPTRETRPDQNIWNSVAYI